jgi:hypothetical protein
LRGSFHQNRSEQSLVFLLEERLGIEKVVEDAVASKRCDFAELEVIIVLASGGIGKVSIGFVDLGELLLGCGIRVVLGVILKCKISIRPLNLKRARVL